MVFLQTQDLYWSFLVNYLYAEKSSFKKMSNIYNFYSFQVISHHGST